VYVAPVVPPDPYVEVFFCWFCPVMYGVLLMFVRLMVRDYEMVMATMMMVFFDLAILSKSVVRPKQAHFFNRK
jgi:hypothetical protein